MDLTNTKQKHTVSIDALDFISRQTLKRNDSVLSSTEMLLQESIEPFINVPP